MAPTKKATRDLSEFAKVLEYVAKPVFAFLCVALPIAITQTRKLWHLFQRLPQNALLFVYGFVFCFFGGTFPTLFSAIQAAEYGGRKAAASALSDLADEAIIIIDESKKDDDADDDKDGKRDVDEASNTEYLSRKTKLVLRKMNPEKVDKALASLYQVWLAIAAVLSIQFARTISNALAIAEFLRKPSDRFLAPTLEAIVPDEYDKWVPIVLAWIVKAFAISLAWYIRSVMSAFASALKGGLMMARAVFAFCVRHNIKMFGTDHNETNVDEILSYIFAAVGFYVQLHFGFRQPFPLNLILSPFALAEYCIRWSITK